MEAGIFSEGSSWVLAGERVVETGGTGDSRGYRSGILSGKKWSS